MVSLVAAVDVIVDVAVIVRLLHRLVGAGECCWMAGEETSTVGHHLFEASAARPVVATTAIYYFIVRGVIFDYIVR